MFGSGGEMSAGLCKPKIWDGASRMGFESQKEGRGGGEARLFSMSI